MWRWRFHLSEHHWHTQVSPFDAVTSWPVRKGTLFAEQPDKGWVGTLCAGQSQPPNHLSMFLEVTDPRMGGTEWSCFVSHRLTVVNQKTEDRAVAKESQNRYSRAAKDWGWREFVTLTSLFDQDAGFLVNDTVIFSAEVCTGSVTASSLCSSL